jgi:aminoglycoside phosphotransferase (APT) family kinase protein
VPWVLSKDETLCVLRLGYIAGTPGPNLIEQGRAEQVLTAAGSLLARLQTDASPVLMPRLEGAGTVAVHGDFGVHNLLFDSTGDHVTGLVDWELAHRGDAVEDLAWAEWIIRMHYPAAIDALGGLFGGYGALPHWDLRRSAMVTQCEVALRLCEREGEPETMATWRARLRTTERWTE